MKNLILFVTTGRCGTQWVARHLGDLYPSQAEVTHEPLGPHYRPASYFRDYENVRRQLSHPAIGSHVDRLERVLATRTYVETGWPAFAAVPLFIELFPGRVRLVHLVRHPVPTSISHAVHQCYYGSPRSDDYTRLATLHPAIHRVFQKELADRWDELTPFEKCLFWWTELNLYARELARRFPEVPLLSVRSEDLLAGDPGEIERLLRHIGLPPDGRLLERTQRLEDRWHHRTDRTIDWTAIHRHPRAVRLAAAFGYELGDVDDAALAARYHGRPSPG